MSFEEIDQYISRGDYAAALTLARKICARDTKDLDGQFYLAKAEFMSGNLAQASELIEQLTKTSANDSAALHYLRGNVYVAKQALPEAVNAFEAAITRDPSFAMAFINLGIVRRQSGDVDGARTALSRATALAPSNVVAWTELAHLHREAGAVADAEACFERALALDASVTSTWVTLGNLLTETFKFPRAKRCFERVLALTPGHELALSALGFVLGEMGETAAAQTALEAKVQHAPSLPRRVRSCLLLPQIYKNVEDLQYWRNRFSNGLDALLDADNDGEEVWKIGQSNFLLAYQGQNDRDFQVRYAEFLRALIAKQRPDFLRPSKHDAELKRKGNGKGRRIRVVFVSSFFRQCTVGHYFRSWITDLHPKIFERIVIHTGWEPDEFGLALQQQCDQFLVVREGVLQVAEAVRSLAADIVIYPEVGMAVMNYLLANMRLAPIQIAAWGHPVTTGSPEIDYFLSCAVMEPSNASSHYTERLLMLPGVGTCYAMPEAINASITRASFGLSHDSHLYICPQSLFKIHPDNDAIYFNIMARDEKAVLLFFQSDHAAITKAFSQRLAAGMVAREIAPRNQIKFLPRMDAASFRGVLSLANVVLDTLHWSGGNTSLDALSVAAPIITHPGEFMRGRQTAAMLRAMDASELIANDHATYVDSAITLASDDVMRESFRQKLIANRGAIFNRSEPVKQLTEHLQMLFETQAQ
jgi:protein O-GlcNAc transferase